MPKTYRTPNAASSAMTRSATVRSPVPLVSSTITNASLAAPQTGQRQSSGRAANGVPGAVFVDGSPAASS